MKKHLLFILVTLLPLVASAEKVEIDGIWYNLITKAKHAEVTSGTKEYSGSITLPATVTYENITYSVTSIEKDAFRDCNDLTAINIPTSVTSIGWCAFYECESLTAVHISSIEAWCKISFDNYDSNPLENAHNLYLNGELVTELVIPEGVTSIKERTFAGCTSLTSITIPTSVTSIGRYAFSYCSDLTSITLPESVTSIGENAFSYCSGLTSITLPESVTSIGQSAFSGCRNLTAINIPESVTSIGGRAFSGCNSLTTINIPEGVTSIGWDVFSDCSSLTTIVLPKSIGSIEYRAFGNCPELIDVCCHAETVPSTRTDAFDGSYIEYATLRVPSNAVNEYKTTSPWSNFGKIVPLSNEEMSVDNFEFKTQDSAPIHNLQGHRVINLSKDGIYIVRGKKIIVK